jgi:CMP/dCMP kinase
MSWQKVIAIDGPSGSGKSTVAQGLAQKLQMLYVDTGAMFRAVGYVLREKRIALAEAPELPEILRQLQLEYGLAESLIKIDGVDLSQKIRQHQVSSLASQVSQLPSVRQFLLEFQRHLAQERFCVMEGRDIGTVVFPQAFCKIFLTASDEERAQRRWNELKTKGQHLEWSQVLRDVRIRDTADSQRTHAPLRQAEDALFLDSTGLNCEQVINRIEKYARDRAREVGLEL